MSPSRRHRAGAAFARGTFLARRIAALGTAVYFGWWGVGLARDGRRMPLGDVSRAAGGSFTIELLLIALVTFHASSSVAVWILERTRAGTRHRLAFVASVALAVGVAVLHLVWLRARP